MQTVTIFQTAKAVNKPYHVPVDQIIKRIREGSSKRIIEELFAETDKDRRKAIKLKLPAICFSGTFSRREDNALIKHSGLIAIDFDHLGDRFNQLRDRLKSDPYTFILFTSPSGDGLKLIVKIPASVATHKLSAAALTDYYNDEKLDEFDDVSRVCFESFDPDIYVNYDSDIFTTIKEEKEVKKIIHTLQPISDHHSILAKLEERVINSGSSYVDGNKHSFLVSLFGMTNYFGIPLNEAVSMISFKYCNAASPVPIKDFERIANSVYRNYGHQFNTATFNLRNEAIITKTEKVIDVKEIALNLPLKDIIYLDAVRDDMLQSFHSGKSLGQSTFFSTIDPHFRWKRGELTLMHGIMNQGKSTMMMQLCLVLAIKENIKWAFFSPEQDPPSDFYDDIVHMYLGQNTQPYYGNQVTESEYIRGMDFVKDHFFYIYPEDESPTPEYINNRFEAIIKKHKIDGCIIDPYNQLDNDIRKTGGREDLYLSAFLSQQKRFAQFHQIFMLIVAHPKGGVKRDNKGDFEIPDIYDLAGGAMWGNKCDNILCTYRPFHRSNPESKSVWFVSQKIKKQRQCGKPGVVTLEFDPVTMRYYEFSDKDGMMKSNPMERKESVNVNAFIEPNFSFEIREDIPY
jgi:hypothetical protein